MKTSQPKLASTGASKFTSVPSSRSGEPAPKKVSRPKSVGSGWGGNRVFIKAAIARRLREIREELFGDHGGPELARRLELPARTWYGYEAGSTLPADVLLRFVELTWANPMFVLAGTGSKYRRNDDA
jgi:hypothetical protein